MPENLICKSGWTKNDISKQTLHKSFEIYPNHSLRFQQKLLAGIKSRTNTNIVKDKDKDINSRSWLFRSMSGTSLPAPNERRQAEEPKMRMLHIRRNSKGTERLRSNFVSLSASSGYNFLSSKFECNFFLTPSLSGDHFEYFAENRLFQLQELGILGIQLTIFCLILVRFYPNF